MKTMFYILSIVWLMLIVSFFHCDFETTRKSVVSRISNTLTDRVVVNFATISRLEETWNVSLNKLNCHLHPLESIASGTRSALKAVETDKGHLLGNDCVAGNIVLAINKFRYKDSKGDPKGFISFLEKSGLPKGFLPRYRGNRLHILFDISQKLVVHYETFSKFFSTGTVSCGGLQSAILKDFTSPVDVLELQVLGLIGKFLSGLWMSKFYTSSTSQTVGHVEGISVVKSVVERIKNLVDRPLELLEMTVNFFNEDLDTDVT